MQLISIYLSRYLSIYTEINLTNQHMGAMLHNLLGQLARSHPTENTSGQLGSKQRYCDVYATQLRVIHLNVLRHTY